MGVLVRDGGAAVISKPQASEYAEGVDDKDVVEFSGWNGLRNNVGAEAFAVGDLSVARNVDILDAQDIQRRRGYSAVLTASVDRSLFAHGATCLGVGSNALKRVNADWSVTTLRSGLTAGRPLSYAPLADRIYWSNGAELGCVQGGTDRSWGLTPPGAFVVSAGAGALPAGKYQVSLTYWRGDGQESGAGRAVAIDLASTGGLDLSAIPPSIDPAVRFIAVYATLAGGETLFRVGTISNGVTTFSVNDPAQWTASPLATQFLQPPPAGDSIAYWKGWMLVASGNRLYPSEPYGPELFDWRKSLPFADRITLVAAPSSRADVVWVGTESSIIRLAGDSPEAWRMDVVAEYGAVPGTLAYFDGDSLGDPSYGETACFASTRGLCFVRPDGSFSNVTADRFAYPIQPRGAGVVRRHAGMVQYLVSMQGAETPGNVAL